MSQLRKIKFVKGTYAHIVLKKGTLESHRRALARALNSFCLQSGITMLVTSGEDDADEIRVEKINLQTTSEGIKE
jgi:hypothetical protein